MWERPLRRDSRDTKVPPTFEIINRFPILIGFDLGGRANRFSQLRGNFSMRPPKSATNPRDAFCELHTISS